MNRSITSAWSQRHKMMLLLVLALLLCYIDRVLISLAAIEMQNELGWSDSDKGFVLSSFFVGYLVMQMLGGILSNRYGGRNIFLFAVVFWSLFTLLTPAAAYTSFAALLLARFLLGIGEGAAYPAAYNLIHGWMRTEERSRAISTTNAAAAMGTILALLVTGVIIERYGWPAVFYLFGGMGLIWTLFWIKHIPPFPPAQAVFKDKETMSKSLYGKPKTPWKLLFTHRAVLTLYLVTACAASISYTLASWLPSYFVGTFGLSISQAGFYSIVPWGAMIVITLAAGIYADKLIAKGVATIVVRKRMVLVGLLTIAFCVLTLTRIDTTGMAVLMVSGVFSGLAIIVPGYTPVAAEILPDHGDILFGFMVGTGSVASSIVVAITGVILENTGSYNFLFFGMAAISMLALIVFQLFAQASSISLERDQPLVLLTNK